MPAIVIDNPGEGSIEFEAKFTFYVFICCFMAAFGGLMFGYDIGISGVTSMDDFQEIFFHGVYLKKYEVRENNYCKFDSKILQLFASSLYLAASVATFFASMMCKKFGRRPTMGAASVFFLAGAILNAAAVNLTMLIIGRIFHNAVPLFLWEIARARIQGGLNIMITMGNLVANIINYCTNSIHPWGWRVSLGSADVPAILLCLGFHCICETPTSLIQRGHLQQGRDTLKKIRSTDSVDAEYHEICHACEDAALVKDPYQKLLNRRNRPTLVISTVLEVFQQFTGINAIMFYAPVLFQTIGFGSDASLLSSVITGSVNMVCTLVSVATVDNLGKKVFLLEAVVQMIISQV